ncbi:MAG: serine/threonine protein kinase [Phycisphaerales bacterium]|nr:serine/threonine protein kinase [Phycisphaerales bacterium]
MSLYLADYRVIEKLGTGANSDIYCVEHLETGELRAAKYVRINEEDEKKFLEQLRAEQATGQSLDHPVLRKIYDLRQIRKRLRIQAAVLLMEYVDGVPMSHSEFRPELPRLLGYFRLVAEGLQVMHHSGYVHADLKPGNMIVTRDDRVKLIDYGQSSAMMHAKERIQGTMDYMAPEQARRSVLDQRTDVFGLGATLFKLLTGRAVTTEMNKVASLHMPSRIGRRLSELKRPISDDIPTCVARLMEDCIKSEPVERLADMRAVINRIDLTLTILDHQRQQHGGTGSAHTG